METEFIRLALCTVLCKVQMCPLSLSLSPSISIMSVSHRPQLFIRFFYTIKLMIHYILWARPGPAPSLYIPPTFFFIRLGITWLKKTQNKRRAFFFQSLKLCLCVCVCVCVFDFGDAGWWTGRLGRPMRRQRNGRRLRPKPRPLPAPGFHRSSLSLSLSVLLFQPLVSSVCLRWFVCDPPP